MSKYKLVLFIGLGLILSFSCSTARMSLKQEQHAFSEIKKVLFAQQAAWNQGNLEAFMEGYWQSEQLSFIGTRGVTKGWITTLENYKKGYPNLDAMGKLKFDIEEIRSLSSDCCLMIGQYTLTRKEDTPSGFFSLIWQKINGEWVITSDHTSG